MYRGYSTSGSSAYVMELGRTPQIYRGYSTSGNAAYTLEYYDSTLRIYRGYSTSGTPFAVIDKYDEVPKPMLMFIVTMLGE
jgi:hypothetical protein